jgi:hypothetical protein
MLQPNTVATPATFTMLVGCVLGIGFMVRFFIALASDGREARIGNKVRPKRVKWVADLGCEGRCDRAVRVSPAAHLAMGVVRITTALASNPRNQYAAGDHPYLVTSAARARQRDSAPERRYRLS